MSNKEITDTRFNYRNAQHRQLEIAYFHMLGSIDEERRGITTKKVFPKSPQEYSMNVIKLTQQVGETVLIDIAENNRKAKSKRNGTATQESSSGKIQNINQEELVLDAAS